jgi:hypothetical protein
MSIQPIPEPAVYVASDIKQPKRFRRTKAEVARIRNAILDILSKDNPQTVRQIFYALTVRGVIAKQEIEYQRTVVRLLVEMREAGIIPFTWIADNTRWMRKPATFTGLESCLQNTSKFYRRDLWAAMPVSGVDAARDIEAKLRRYAPGAEIHFERPAVTRAQVEEWNLPTRPTKQTDTRAKKFGSTTSVELDAIPARKLRELVREVINRHVDQQKLEFLRTAEKSERELLTAWAATYRGSMR